MTTYTWTDNPMQGGGTCNVDTVNEDLMYLKYDNVSPQDGKIPYSVNLGKQDANGYAAFIQKDNDTQITILAGGSNPNLVLSYPDGSIETISSNIVINSGLTNNGTYIIVKEKGNNTPVLVTGSNIIIEALVAPTGVDGDYFLNIAAKPLVPKKKVSGSWADSQYIKLGEVTKTSGTLGTPISYAFNGYYKLENTDNFPALDAITTKYHNIGTTNIILTAYMRCKTAENGWSVGQYCQSWNNNGGSGVIFPGALLNINDRNSMFYISNGSTISHPCIQQQTGYHTYGYIAEANWSLVWEARRNF